jgi:hypothetical protein
VDTPARQADPDSGAKSSVLSNQELFNVILKTMAKLFGP